MKLTLAFALACSTLAAASARASTVEALSLEDLQDQSALVLVGYVTNTNTSASDAESVAGVEIAVVDCLTGLCPDDVSVVGASTDDGAPQFARGQEVLVFLRPENGGFVVVGMAQGLFLIQREGPEPVAVSDRSGLSMVEDTGRPSLVDTVTYPLDDLVNGIRLGLPVTPIASN